VQFFEHRQRAARYHPGVPHYDASTALIVVDVQNDFADPAGSLVVPGGAEVVPFINEQIEAVLAAGGHVVYSQDWHPPSTPHFEKDGGIWPVHCVAGTWGAEFHPDLTVKGPVIRKGTEGEDGYSAFSVRHPVSGHTRSTELERLLDEANVSSVFVVGLATDYCVHATVKDARSRGLQTTVLTAGVRAVEIAEGDGERALAELEAEGATIESGVH
jgi:nicotinamidase/pyrazinamidase